MKGFFAFDWVYKKRDAKFRSFRFLFKASGTLRPTDLADSIEVALRRSLFPDVLAIICSRQDFSDLKLAFVHAPDVIQAIKRASGKTTIVVCQFGAAGQIVKTAVVANGRGIVRDALAETSEIHFAGLSALFEIPGILVEAPPGFVFYKPSGGRSTVFLRTEEALYENERAEFVAYCLLAKLAERESEARMPIATLYIDSMAIASVAYALRDLYCAMYNKPRPQVVSFHSYGGLNEIEAPLPGTSMCLISASTSMRLGDQWSARTRCFSSEVVTLLTLGSAKGSHAALHSHPAPKPLVSPPESEAKDLRDLRILGERFSPESISPKKVLLKAKEHGSDAVRDFAQALGTGAEMSVQKRSLETGAKTRPIFVDGALLLSNQYFQQFVDKAMMQYTPASVQAIIFQDDAASAKLATACSETLAALMPTERKIPTISGRSIEGAKSLDKNKALLIVAAVVGRGSRLLSLSRDLRDKHTGARTYLVGVQIAETYRQADALKTNLKFSSAKSSIIVEVFRSLAVGYGLANSFVTETAVLDGLLNQAERRRTCLGKRLEILRNSAGLGENVFLPRGREAVDMMALRKDFSFWRSEYTPVKEMAPAVFASVAAILQNARESRDLSAGDRLATDAFQQVVLEPENFARFNDGVVQAALLRAAHTSELDYSHDDSASEHMLQILTKIFEQCERPQGEASLEFALALNTGRLKLTAQHAARLRESVRPSLVNGGALHRFLARLLGLVPTRSRATRAARI